MKSSKSLSGLNQKYRGKPKKYAEGGRVGRAVGAVRRAVTGATREDAPTIRGLSDVRPPTDNIRDVIDSNFNAGRLVGDRMMPIDEVYGGSVSGADSQRRVQELADRIAGPEGYFSRIIVDQDGNVIEGAHRIDALRLLGATEVPVTQVEDIFARIDKPRLDETIRASGLRTSDHVNRVGADAVELLGRYGSPEAVLNEIEFPPGFDSHYRAALTEAHRQLMPPAARNLEDLDRKYAEGGEVMSDEDYDSRLLSRMKAQMGRASEPTRAEQMQALRTAGRSAAEGLADVLLPQSPLDVALMVALGPGGRAARLAGSAALASLEPSEAEAGVIRRAANAIRGLPTVEGYRPVFPQPERLIPEAERVTGGRYLENPRFDPATRQGAGVDITGETRAGARVQIDPSGKAVMLVSPQGAELPTERSQGPLIRANLFRRSAGWDWAGEPPPGARDFPTIVSVKHGKNHYYALGTDFEGPVQMSRYPGDAEPRLKPTAKGDIELGREIGRISVRGKEEHPVYDMIYNIPRYSHGGLAALDQKYADGGTVRAPKETTIAGQDHRLAYITDREAALLKARGGSGRMTEHGVRAYNEGPGGEGPGGEGPGGDPSDNAGSMSESATQDAVGGNQGQGAGPTGAGAGSGPPGGPDSNPNEDAGTETSVTAPTTAPTTGAFGQFGAATGLGVVGGLASFGIGAPGLGTAAAGFGAALDAAKANEQLGMMGLNQTVDRDSAVANAVSMGAFGQSVANQFGQALGFDALAEAPMSAFSTPDPLGDIAASQMDSGGSQYEQTEYGTPGLSNIATSMAPATAASLVDWNQIQREASALNMSVSDYLAMKWRSPAAMARGGVASLEKMHAKYAEGGDVRAPAGEVAEYNPEEIDRIARQIHLRFPEEDLIRPSYEDVESPSDLTMRARLMMRGQNVGLPETVGMGGGNDMFSSSTSMRNIPIESEPYGTSQRMLNTGINAVLDAERNARIGAGMLALERSGERGFTGYGPQLSAGYGPASIYGGYQAITPNIPGAKSQGSYVYGGSLNIPIDDSGTEANIGGSVMSGRRNASNTQIMGSLERPLLGGRLALELAADPSLRHKEILLGYRRAF